MPAFAFPAKAGTHLPTPEGWKAELALGGWGGLGGLGPSKTTSSSLCLFQKLSHKLITHGLLRVAYNL